MKSKQAAFEDFVNCKDEIDSVKRHLRFENARLYNKHFDERISLLRLSEAVKDYQRDVTKKQKGKIGRNARTAEASIKLSLNHVDWDTFKAYGTIPEADSSVIDILVGEPALPDSPFGPVLLPGRKSRRFPDELKTASSKESTTPGQASSPERIRLHSSILLAILDKIHGTAISKNGDAVVMVRPFKALTLYKTQLRDWIEKGGGAAPGNLPSGIMQTTTPDTQVTEVKTKALRRNATAVGFDLPEPKEGEADISLPPNTGSTQSKEDDITMSMAAFNHLRCLFEFMDETIVEKQNYLRQHCRRVAFVDLWHLFRPGVEVVEPGDKHMQCYKVINVTSPRHKVTPRYLYPFFRSKGKGETAVTVHCVYIDFDGTFLGPVSKRFDIPRYEGQKDVKSLPVYPLSLVKNNGTIRQSLMERGDKFLKVLRVGHMHYNGLTLESRDEVDSQVVVDFAEALANRDDRKTSWKPEVQPRAEPEKKPKEKEQTSRDNDGDSDDENDPEGCDAECCKGENVHDDNYVDQKQYEQFLSNLLADTDEEENPAPLAVLSRIWRQDKAISVTDDDKVIMSHRVFAFVLRSRSWAKLDLEGLVDLEEYRKKQEKERPTEQRNENAFDNLVFPEDGLDRKRIVRSLVAQHFRDKESGATREEQSDIHTNSQLTKVMVPEGIAELFNKPLFQITCGDLGTTAREVEAALETNFALANKWGSILLLDEADVFLARRTPQDFKRNGLVAVFLRVLEYYAGILFLTTNRIGDFDEAFSSRIHISLHYPALDYDSTIGIFELNWRLMKARFAHKGRTLDIDTTKITGYITNYWHNEKNARWNGRQIRNACQTALALAEFEAQGTDEDGARNPDAKVRLGVSHMKIVANAYLEFIKYLEDVRDADQERYAYTVGIRRREGRGIAAEDPFAYDPSSSFRRGQPSRLAEHRAQFAAKYSRPDPGAYQQGYSSPYSNLQTDRQSYGLGVSPGTPSNPPYQPYSGQPQGGGPYQRSPDAEPQRGWNPGPVGGYYGGSQETLHQQGAPPAVERYLAHSQHHEHMAQKQV
ncbi:hypothetical protein F5Y06DRAFT_306691 [Hypoxylon sp. FL0890]|nr:hypothetical protein F5Y06DRAFT_306691 [Hypoxylon sp. FL0890]